MKKDMEFGVVGLGRMGGNLALQAVQKGMRVVGFDKGKVDQYLCDSDMVIIDSMQKLTETLKPPRIVFIYVPAGPIVDTVIDGLLQVLEEKDIIVDGGNSYWGDSIRRSNRLQEKKLHFVDCGTSGGVKGAREGACFMIGGEPEPVSHVEPILLQLATQNGYVHAGPPGAGHFTKLVHNGIEFGMLQAIGEGMNLLEHYQDDLNIPEVLKCWRHGSVIRSWLIDLMHEQYQEQNGGQKVPAYIEDTGEVNWLVGDAMNMEVPVPVIAQSVMQLFASRDQDKQWAKCIAMMRHGFGGHPFGADEAIVLERREGKIGTFYRPEEK